MFFSIEWTVWKIEASALPVYVNEIFDNLTHLDTINNNQLIAVIIAVIPTKNNSRRITIVAIIN